MGDCDLRSMRSEFTSYTAHSNMWDIKVVNEKLNNLGDSKEASVLKCILRD